MINIEDILNNLLLLESENEIVEFKEANTNFDFDDIGKYFSALSNEANLAGKKSARLVFGIRDKDHVIIGTQYRISGRSLQSLKEEIGNHTTNRISFQEIHEVKKSEGRVIVFQIPGAPKGIPISRKGHYYARDHESLQPLNISKIERIRQQTILEDWSAGICSGATINDLDPDAISKARSLYITKNPEKKTEIESRDDTMFLNKAKITIQGKITRTAILLLGKSESEHFISPAIAKISRILKDRDGIELDYQHFSCPFLLATELIYKKIRNLKYRYIADTTLFPDEVDKYDPYVIREAINNCIAHQDYTLAGKINVIENEDTLIFTNRGSFIPQTIENVIEADSPSEYYRNRFLADAMVNLKMIDTIGSGIKKMFISQKEKFFPLPEYDLSNEKVALTITGKVLDINYARKLAQIKNISLYNIMLLDKIQKGKNIDKKEIKKLKDQGLIEGSRGNYYISANVARQTDQKTDYIKQRGFKDDYYKKLILDYLDKYKSVNKKDIDKLLLDILPGILDKQKKLNKIRNIIYSMSRKDKTIKNEGTKRNPIRKKFN